MRNIGIRNICASLAFLITAALVLVGPAALATDPAPGCDPDSLMVPNPELGLAAEYYEKCALGFPVNIQIFPLFTDFDTIPCGSSPGCNPDAPDCLDLGEWNIMGPGSPTISPFGSWFMLNVYEPGVYVVGAQMRDVGDNVLEGAVWPDCGFPCVSGSRQDWGSYQTRTVTIVVRHQPRLSCPLPGADYSDVGGGDGGCGGGSCGTGGGGPISVNARDGDVRLSNPLGIPGAAFGEAASRQQLTEEGFSINADCAGGPNSARYVRCNGQQCALFAFNNVWYITAGSDSIGAGWTIEKTGGGAGAPETYTLTLADGRSFTATAGQSVMDSVTSADGRTTSYQKESGVLTGFSTQDGAEWGITPATNDYRPGILTYPDGTTAEFEYYSHGDGGGLKKITRKNGTTILGVVEYAYDGDGKIISGSVQSGAGDKTTYVVDYDSQTGKVSTISEEIDESATGRETTYSFGSESIQTRPGYSPSFAKTVITAKATNEPDRITTKYYYKSGQDASYLFKAIDPEGNETENHLYGFMSYFDNSPAEQSTLNGRPWRVKDAAGRFTTYEYYTGNQLVKKVIYTDGESFAGYTYTDNNKVETVRDVRGAYTKYEYDQNGHVKNVLVKGKDEQNFVLTKSYAYYEGPAPRKGLLASETVIRDLNPNNPERNQTTIYDYLDWDENGNPGSKWRTAPTMTVYEWLDVDVWTSAATKTSYDDSGRVKWSQDALGNKTSYEYDAQGRVTKVTYPGPSGNEPYKEYSYNCCHLEWESDENGKKTYYSYYDTGVNAGRLKEVANQITGTSPLVCYEYNGFGEKTAVRTYKDASDTVGRTTTYTYDKLGRVTQIDYPGTNLLASEYYRYNALGQLVGKKLDDGTTAKMTAYMYDDLNRLIAVDHEYSGTWQDLPNYTSFTADDIYDYEGNTSLLAQRVDAAGVSAYEYDSRGRLSVYTPPTPSGWSVEYGYNNANEKKSVTVSDGTNSWATTYEYYRNGWLSGVSGSGRVTVKYAYDKTGKPLTEIYGDGNGTTLAQYSYNSKLQLSALYHYRVGTPNTVITKTDYDRDNVGSPTQISWDYGTGVQCHYDAVNRLSEMRPYPQDYLMTSYYYDWVGNQTWMTVNEVDQALSGGSSNYTYDSHYGNLSSLTYQSEVTTYEYDNYNLLKKIIWPDETDTQFLSDAAGNRVAMTTSQSNTYSFIYDTTAGIPAVLVEKVASQDPKLYIRTPDGRLIARVTAAETPTLDFYYHFDGLGSTRALTDVDGNTTDTYTYSVWGEVSHQGLTSQPYQFVGQLGYYTHYQDPKLSNGEMLQLGVRYYVPGLGRFTQRDRVRQPAESSYVYASDNPAIYTDASGLYRTGRGNCASSCPALASWVAEINRRLRRPACKRALERAGCDKFIRPSLPDVIIDCVALDEGVEGQCGGERRSGFAFLRDSVIELDCAQGASAGTILHELVHACHFSKGRSGPDPTYGWGCPDCTRRWRPGEGDMRWEGPAEDVRHSCGF